MPQVDEKVRRRLFTVDEYHRMGEAGILTEDDRVQLIEGEIIEMPPIGSPHGGALKSLLDLLRELPRDAGFLSVQDPLTIVPKSEPQPDLMILRRRDDNYRTSNPGPEDVLLLVEGS